MNEKPKDELIENETREEFKIRRIEDVVLEESDLEDDEHSLARMYFTKKFMAGEFNPPTE